MDFPVLNPEQKKAVEYNDGPLLIIAGAGTGKTAVITRKIHYLIQNKLARPDEILALTFTDKAAEEMIDRVDALLQTGYTDMRISTFHAFCRQILESRGLDIGVPNRFKLLTETDAWLLARANLDRFNLEYYRPIGNPNRHIHELIRHFSKCKDELISPEEYLAYAESVALEKDAPEINERARLTEVANAYHNYNQLLLDNEALDFGDLIFYANRLVMTRPNVLQELQQKFKYILVDEFQDVNWAQYQLVKTLAANGARLTVVGDDDQAIYAFRGASVSNIMRFRDDFPGAQSVVLTRNYRSGQNILDLAHRSISHNDPDRLEVKFQIDKRLVSESKNKGATIHSHFATLDEQVNFTVKEIQKIKSADKKATWDDFAILVRANAHAEPFLNALQKAGLPYEYLASAGLYRQPIVLDCHNFFKVIDGYHESLAIYRLLNLAPFNLSVNDTQKFTQFAKRKSLTYYETLKRAKAAGVSEDGQKIMAKILDIIHDGMRRAREDKPTTVLYGFLEASGYLQYLTRAEGAGDSRVINQIYQLKQFFDYLREYENTTPDARVHDFLIHFQYVTESGDEGRLYQPADTPDSVNILTIHSAKGLEFKYVFMPDLVEERFPTRRRGEGIDIPGALIKETLPEGDEHIGEERRLFYVGLTRAKERLYLMSATDYGGTRAKKISRFLAELDFAGSAEKSAASSAVPASQAAATEQCGEMIYELPKAFSFSQIKSYNSCPYQYKLNNILRLPTAGSPAFSFGQTIHATLQKFYEEVQRMNNAVQTDLFSEIKTAAAGEIRAPSEDELLKMYEVSWLDDWYKSPRQREEYFNEGKKILKQFYRSHAGAWRVPVGLEKWFKIKVGEYLVHGRIDRIDRGPDGQLEIIDYKTGQSKDQLKTEDKDQLFIYQIAATELPEFQTLGPVGQLTFYYVNDDKKMSFLGTDKELEKFRDKLIKILDKIKTRDFTATPDKFTCQYCDFRDICEFKK